MPCIHRLRTPTRRLEPYGPAGSNNSDTCILSPDSPTSINSTGTQIHHRAPSKSATPSFSIRAPDQSSKLHSASNNTSRATSPIRTTATRETESKDGRMGEPLGSSIVNSIEKGYEYGQYVTKLDHNESAYPDRTLGEKATIQRDKDTATNASTPVSAHQLQSQSSGHIFTPYASTPYQPNFSQPFIPIQSYTSIQGYQMSQSYPAYQVPTTGPEYGTGWGTTMMGVQEYSSGENLMNNQQWYSENGKSEKQRQKEYLGYDMNAHDSNYTASRPDATTLPNWTYQNVDELRTRSNLYEFATALDPSRRNNAILGLHIDIIDGISGHMIMPKVPKKLLMLFCGRDVLNPFLKTLSRYEKSAQQLRVPQSVAMQYGFHAVIGWMIHACQLPTTTSLRPIENPRNLFHTICICIVLDFFKLYRDRARMDVEVWKLMTNSRLYANQVKQVWDYVPRNSRYTFRLVRYLANVLSMGVKKQRRKALGNSDDLLRFIEANPDLKRMIEEAAD
ncbi:hypothetical protein EJ04DRAFT_564478 [Polyplosphaeria fusca]|uniref:Uncharacterized protein n=1 Tax=Polyplosphaeria fusca TaxID=682080 RepID=A0A9P4QWX7_9PLEO|nr:hypothetical protein EJ04DRAFT_564478 [Polyplosphaeria fusca]